MKKKNTEVGLQLKIISNYQQSFALTDCVGLENRIIIEKNMQYKYMAFVNKITFKLTNTKMTMGFTQEPRSL